MKKFPIALGLLLVLAACGQSANTELHLSFVNDSDGHHQELLDASVRVLQGHLKSKNVSASDMEAMLVGSGAVIRCSIADAEARSAIVQQLTEPFSFLVMATVPKEQATIWNEKMGGFAVTGITEKDLAWTTANALAGSKTGNAVIGLTSEGQRKLHDVFAANMGKQIGIFARGRLMSRKYVNETDLQKNSIEIDGIPQAAIATAFADDMNVGAHVVFQSTKNASSAASSSSHS